MGTPPIVTEFTIRATVKFSVSLVGIMAWTSLLRVGKSSVPEVEGRKVDLSRKKKTSKIPYSSEYLH